ncbi:FKBP-type peptidyl-prolyl cis-trans isomerase, partial [bacterium]|nr:FKBP-type peptidyl-prolyl cis-trans isomerase [bacterium]
KELNPALVGAAMADLIAEKEDMMFADDQAANTFIQGYVEEQGKIKAEENIVKGEEFLAKNKEAEGVVTTESGLQYEIITKGDGAIPTAEDKVTVHYHGTLIDGTVFDSSVDRGEPASFPVTGVIPGWTEALQLMPVGSKWKLTIPSALAYGPRAASALIAANSTLVFDVELISIDAK